MTALPTPGHDPAVHGELLSYVTLLYGRARAVLGEQCEATVTGVAGWYSEALAGDETMDPDFPGLPAHAAREIVTHLVDASVTGDAAFWSTALGRAVAWHIGYREEQVPREVVAALLGVSRQRVHAMAQSKVGYGRPVGFTASEVRAIFRERWLATQRRVA